MRWGKVLLSLGRSFIMIQGRPFMFKRVLSVGIMFGRKDAFLRIRQGAPALALGLIGLVLAGCGGKRSAVDRITENGVEVVLNHLDPYQIPGRPASLTLEEIAAVDTESDAVAKAGVTDVYLFDVDSRGNIYVVVPPTHPGTLIFKLSPEGKPLLSFGRMGQGPFELEYPYGVFVDASDRIWVLESPKNKYHVYDASGKPLLEGGAEAGFEDIVQLDKGTFLVTRLEKGDLKGKYLSFVTGIAGEDFRIRREIDRFASYPNRLIAAQVPEKYVSGIDYVYLAKTSRDRIFTGNSDRGYEILVFDLQGKLLRKVRKEYKPVPVPDEFRKKTLKMYEEGIPEYAAKMYFPENWHPFQSFIADEAGRLLVMTYEPGNGPGESVFDIYDSDGVFVGRTSLNVVRPGLGRILAKIRGDSLYAIQEKASGFKRLAVYRMIWK
jgi:hypothetical protein